MTDVRVLLANNIKKYREIMDISQMGLADKIGCSPTLIGKIETMKRFPSPVNLNRIAKALDITPAELFEDFESSKTAKSMASKQKRKAQLKLKLNKYIDDYFA